MLQLMEHFVNSAYISSIYAIIGILSEHVRFGIPVLKLNLRMINYYISIIMHK